MKFNFWKKEKKVPEKQEIDNRIKDNSDDSYFYDYDKVCHNQFLTNDEVKGKYFDSNQKQVQESQSAYYKKYVKNQNMISDDVAFRQINNEINANLNLNKNEFGFLNKRADEINTGNKIPVKKKSFFSKKNDSYFANEQLAESSSNYNIVENRTKKFEDSVDYYSLKKDQTKLLDLDEIFSNSTVQKEENPIKDEQLNNENLNNNFYVDKTKSADLTNRLFINESEQVKNNTQDATTIPRKTIKLSFDNSNEYMSLNEAKVNASNNFQQQNIASSQNVTLNLMQNNNSPLNNQQDYKRIPTTALRYLTPVDEEEDSRIKKEERRFIKLKE